MEGSISIALLASAAASAQKFKHQHKKIKVFIKLLYTKQNPNSYTPPHCTIDFKKQSVINEQRILFYFTNFKCLLHDDFFFLYDKANTPILFWRNRV